MKADVRLPGAGTPTTPIGVGLATLMREPSPRRQQRLLAAAYEAGIRHFDVAPSYGLGTAEAALGRFLRTRPAGVTVATKVGIVARGNAGLMRTLQRPARALIQRFPALRGRATQALGAAVHAPPDFSPQLRERSLANSLRSLGVDCLDVLLLHEPEAADLTHGDVVEWLQRVKERGLARNVGIAASACESIAAAGRLTPALDVAQCPWHVAADAETQLPSNVVRIVHSVLAVPLAAAITRARQDPEWARELSNRSGADIGAQGVLARLLLACAVNENRGGIVLVGSSSESHLRDAAQASGAFDGAQLAAAASLLRGTLGA